MDSARAAAATAAPFVRLPLSEAQRAAGLAFDQSGAIVDSSGRVLAAAGADAARLVSEGSVAAARGAEYARQYVAALIAAGSPYAARGLTEAQTAAGMAYDEAGNIVGQGGVLLAKAGADAAAFAHEGAVQAALGADAARGHAQALLAAGSPYVMRGLTEAQRAAGLAINESGAIVNQAGVMIAPAGEAAAKFCHEGVMQAQQGAAIAQRYAASAVSAASPYAAMALTAAQRDAGVMYNKAGQLVNSAGQFVNPAGQAISQGMAAAQMEAARAAQVIAPAAAGALSEAQRAAGVAFNAAGQLVNRRGEFVDEAGRVLSQLQADARYYAAVAAPIAAAAAAGAAEAAMNAAGEMKEAAAYAANAAAPMAAAVGSAVSAGMNDARAAGQVAGMAVMAAARDVYNSPFAQGAMERAFTVADDSYAMSRDAIAGAIAALSGVSLSIFDFVKFDIVRDFFQMIALFFATITSAALAEAKDFWGNISNVVAFDLNWFKVNPIVYYVIVGIIVVIVGGFFIWFVAMAGKLTPDTLREGYEVTTWDELAASRRKTLKVFKLVLTACTSAYLPVSRLAVQVLVCESTFAATGIKAGLNFKLTASGGYDCFADNRYVYLLIASIVLVAGYSLFFPIWLYRQIRHNIPVGSPEDPSKRYDADGVLVEYTDAMFNEDVNTDPRQVNCPFQFLYKGYERKWAFYKIIQMCFKVIVILPVLLLSRSPVPQTIVTLVLLLIYSVLSFYSSPFISPMADRMDLSGRVTTFLTVLCGLIASASVAPTSGKALGVIVNILNALNAVVMIIGVLLGLDAVKTKIKNITGRFEFHDSVKGVNGPGVFIIPGWDLVKECKHRIWHSFWNSVVLKMCGDEAAKRLLELQSAVADVGKAKVINHYRALQVPGVREWRMWVQQNLEGVDVFWDGVPLDGFNNSKTRFGKMYVKPFPFHCVIAFDDCDDVCFIWEDQFGEFVQKNQMPDIQARRLRRQQLRALHGNTVHLEFEQDETRSIPDGQKEVRDQNGNVRYETRYSTVTVRMYYHRGHLAVKAVKDADFARGFNVSISYSDGHGVAIAPNTGQQHNITGSTVIGHAAIGITEDFQDTPRLRELLYDPENSRIVAQNMPAWHEKCTAYRTRLIQSRAVAEQQLNSSFWLNVFDCYNKPQGELIQYLTTYEANPKINRLHIDQREGMQFLYNRLQYVNSNPAAALWFVFWDDFWQSNQNMVAVKDKAATFDPKNPAALCYRPMQRDRLQQLLEPMGLVGTKMCCVLPKYFTPRLLDTLYARMDTLNDQAKGYTPANAV